MKILHTVQLYHPAIGGSEEVIKQISERLAKRGHDVTVATAAHPQRKDQIINGVKIREFTISGNEVNGIEGQKTEYQQFLLEEKFDVMLNYGMQIWSTDLVFPLLPKINAKKFLVPLGFFSLNDPAYKNYYEKMPKILRQYNANIYLSKNYQDIQFAKSHGIQNDIVIPNAASEDEFLNPSPDFRKKFGIKTKYLLLSVSNHYELKGHQLVLDAFKKLQRKDVTLALIGGKPANFNRFSIGGCYYPCLIQSWFKKNLRFLDHITREDTVAAFKAADLFVFGSKFECSPLVIFEAMASKTPFISTNCGNVEDFKAYGALIQTADEMANEMNHWLDDTAQREKTGEAAYQNWLKNFTWKKITDQYEQLYKQKTPL